MRFTSNYLHLISLGCTKNLVDSEVMLGRLKTYQLTPEIEMADIIIINTCGFIESAKQESIQAILQASAARKKGAVLVVSGCLSERYEKELREEIPEIDIITGVGDYDKIDVMVKELKSLRSKEVFLADEKHERVIIGSAFHAYIKLSEGCNQSCSFCAIPSFKGKLHSRSLHSTLKEVQNLYERGYRDFSFIAQDSSSYLRDLGEKDGLIQLIRAVDKLGLPISCRILYLYPTTTTLRLIETIGDSTCFVPYFDMPIQHIADSMLKRMRRGANKLKHTELLESMRKIPQSFIRTSFVIGHPGESDEEFRELCEFVEGFVFDRVNLFAYSPQVGTFAYDMPQSVSAKLTNARLNALNRIIKAQFKKHNQALLGQEVIAICEGKSEMSEYLYKSRLKLWGKDIDGEILINDSEICDEQGQMLALQEGYYRIVITECKQNFLFAKALERLQ